VTALLTAPRLLAGVHPDRPLRLDEHLEVHGPLPPLTAEQVVDIADAAGLRGRGGAGFPVARKLRTARDAGRRAVVVANGSEGEPAIGKDRLLLTRAPHLVLDGLQLAARAVGAREAFLCVHVGGTAAVVRAALAERRDGVPVRVVEVADRYVAGEAGALVRRLGGGPSLPSTRAAPLAQRGLRGRPTLVQNVESLAALAVATRLGPDRYREVGDAAEPGTLLVTVHAPGEPRMVLELPTGTPVHVALGAADVQAVLVGGFFGAWLHAPAALDVPLSHAGLRAAGGSLGAGLVVGLPPSHCGLAVSARVARYLADQSARQCGPCLNGLPAIASALAELAAGTADAGVVDRLHRWCGLVQGRGACAHPDGAAGFVRSALRVFADDVVQHLRGGCGRPAGAWPELR
jgi:NADH:ubiquinone oxidoreductase subunit F (NADH-binding)